MALVFSAVFVGADNVLHAKFGREMEAKEILTRGAICWIRKPVLRFCVCIQTSDKVFLALIPVAFVTTKFVGNWMFRAVLFVATSGLAHKLVSHFLISLRCLSTSRHSSIFTLPVGAGSFWRC